MATSAWSWKWKSSSGASPNTSLTPSDHTLAASACFSASESTWCSFWKCSDSTRWLRWAHTEKRLPPGTAHDTSQLALGATGGETISMVSPAPKRAVSADIAAVALGTSSLAGSQAHIGEGGRGASRNCW